MDDRSLLISNIGGVLLSAKNTDDFVELVVRFFNLLFNSSEPLMNDSSKVTVLGGISPLNELYVVTQ